MDSVTQANDRPASPLLSELMSQYLQRRIDWQGAGFSAIDESAAIVPFDAVAVQPVDPKTAWHESIACLGYFQQKPDKGVRTFSLEVLTPFKLQIPPGWSELVNAQPPTLAVAFALGNYPQIVRDFHPLLEGGRLADLRSTPETPLHAPEFVDWAVSTLRKKRFPASLLAHGSLRLARHFDRAVQIDEKDVPDEWQAAWANERAALEWHRGRSEEAATLWKSQAESVPVLFNRGMAALFLDRHADARALLVEAVAQIPENSAWHHLGQLYLTLTEIRR